METIRSVLMLGLVVFFVPPIAAAGELQFDYTLIARNLETPAPGIEDVLAVIGSPLVSGSQVAFYGAAGDYPPNSNFVPTHEGLYIRDISGTGSLTIIADWLTPIPDGIGTFTSLRYVSFEAGGAAFRGEGEAGQIGIYKYRNSVLSTVADLTTDVPGQPAGTPFTDFYSDAWFCESDMTAFGAFFTNGQGVYVEIEGALNLVADTNTDVPPGGLGNFVRFGLSNGAPAVDAGRVAFFGVSDVSSEGIYLWDNRVLELVADTATPVPGGFGTFTRFNPWRPVNIDGAFVVFRGEWINEAGNDQTGIYSYQDGVLSVLADFSTVISNAGERLTSIGAQGISLDGREVAFLGNTPTSNNSIYATTDGSLIEVAREGFVAGQTTEGVYPQSRDAGIVAFQGGVQAAGPSGAIWVAMITLCGDGLVNPETEECDDGNDVSGDGCSSCRLDVCGDVNDSGGVDAADITRLRVHLAAPLSLPLSVPGRAKCPVIEPDACDIGAATVLQRALHIASLPPGIAPVCPFVTSLAPDGAFCGSNAECVSRFCTEAVCCDSACLSACDSCLETNTANPDGICAPRSTLIEVCDGVDNDCDRVVDEPNTPDCSLFFTDRDGDGFGPPGATSACLCHPIFPHRATELGDCRDIEPLANPAQTSFFSVGGGGVFFDYNCDSVEELEISTLGSCIVIGTLCGVRRGWQGSVPACGQPGLLVSRCDFIRGSCIATTRSAVQACR